MTRPLLPSRTYRLTRDVPNPERDRRTKRTLPGAEYKKGMRFYANALLNDDRTPTGKFSLHADGYYDSLYPSHGAYADLVVALELEPLTVDNIMEQEGLYVDHLRSSSHERLLAFMLESGRLTEASFREACAAFCEYEDKLDAAQ